MTKSEIKVLVVDDELLARKRIRSLLSEHADIKIVGECVNGREAINAMHNLTPDLVFLDIQMPEINGLQVIGNLDDKSVRCSFSSRLTASTDWRRSTPT
jgi:YesN/AraC family two-component response regulator